MHSHLQLIYQYIILNSSVLTLRKSRSLQSYKYFFNSQILNHLRILLILEIPKKFNIDLIDVKAMP